jgi:hypothetical protein
MAEQYLFTASGDSCEKCSAMDGQITSYEPAPPHDNCMCQVIPISEDDNCPNYEWTSHGSKRYGPGGASFSFGLDITVHCCDGSEISQSAEIDMGEEAQYGDDTLEAMDEAVGEMAAELASECPEPPEPNVS